MRLHPTVLQTTVVCCLLTPVSFVQASDLREALPADMFLAVHIRENPERQYQDVYIREFVEAVRTSQLPGQIANIIASHSSPEKAERLKSAVQAIQKALEPVDWEKLLDASEIVYGQKLEGPATRMITIVRMPDDGAAKMAEGFANLLKLGGNAAGDQWQYREATFAEATLSILEPPADVPFSVVTGVRGDLFVFSSQLDVVEQSLQLLNDPAAVSKFDDPRLADALRHLPESEDVTVFYDGRLMMEQYDGLIEFLRKTGEQEPLVGRAADLQKQLMAGLNVIDYEVTVETTNGFYDTATSFGKAMDGYQSTLLGKMLTDQQPFADWEQWVPTTTTGFTMHGGANLHPLYEWVTTVVPETFPEVKPALEKLAVWEDRFDMHLDSDLLQSFSGEFASISLPGPMTPLGPSSKSVIALRCQNPDRIRELLRRAHDAFQQIPQIQAQGITVTESTDLPGFHEINAGIFALLGGLQPVIGFHDGWMVIATHKDAVQTIQKTRQGELPNFSQSETFQNFGLTIEGDIRSVSYTRTGPMIRQVAQLLQQAGTLAPVVGLSADGNDSFPARVIVQDILALLPGIGRVIAKLDFMEATVSVTQDGPATGTWITRSVTQIRPPKNREE